MILKIIDIIINIMIYFIIINIKIFLMYIREEITKKINEKILIMIK